jgi:aconitate hydratase
MSLNSFGARDRLVVDGENYGIFRLDRLSLGCPQPAVLLENGCATRTADLPGDQVQALPRGIPAADRTEIQFTSRGS